MSLLHGKVRVFPWICHLSILFLLAVALVLIICYWLFIVVSINVLKVVCIHWLEQLLAVFIVAKLRVQNGWGVSSQRAFVTLTHKHRHTTHTFLRRGCLSAQSNPLSLCVCTHTHTSRHVWQVENTSLLKLHQIIGFMKTHSTSSPWNNWFKQFTLCSDGRRLASERFAQVFIGHIKWVWGAAGESPPPV